MKALTKEKAEGNLIIAQQVNETKKLTSAVNAMSKKMDGFTEMMGTFLLVITQQMAAEDNTAEAHNLLTSVRKMSGITDGVWDDERANVADLETRRDPYPHDKTPLDSIKDGRVVKALDLSSNGQMSVWVWTPLLMFYSKLYSNTPVLHNAVGISLNTFCNGVEMY